MGKIEVFVNLRHSELAQSFDALSDVFNTSSTTLAQFSIDDLASSSASEYPTEDFAFTLAGKFARTITSFFKSIGIEIAQGFLKVKEIVVENLLVDKATIADLEVKTVMSDQLSVNSKVTVGSAEHRIGFTIFDRLTGEPQCVFSEGGTLRQAQGECGADAIGPTGPIGHTGVAEALTLPDQSPTGIETGEPESDTNSNENATTTEPQLQAENSDGIQADPLPATTTPAEPVPMLEEITP